MILSFWFREGRFCLSHSIAERAIARPALHLKQFVIPSKARNPLFASDASNAWPAHSTSNNLSFRESEGIRCSQRRHERLSP
mgnify:CR=1 FL=1